MNVGKAVEEAIIESCKREGLYVDNNVKFQVEMGGVPIAGEIDAILRTEPCGNTRYIMECKSLYGYYAGKEAFGKHLKMGKKPGAPKHSYVMQIALYLNYYSRLPEDDPRYIPFGAIFISDRGDGHFGVFDIWLEEKTQFLSEDEVVKSHAIVYKATEMGVPTTILPYTIEDILQRYREVLFALKNDTVPPRDFLREYSEEIVEKRYKQGMVSDSAYKKWKTSHGSRGKGKEKLSDWQCSYCPFHQLCWEIDKD